MMLDADEIRLILDVLREKYGPGYCMEPAAVGRLQAKLRVASTASER